MATIITIQGIDIWGNRVADRMYSSSESETKRKMQSFAKMYHLIDVEVV